MATILQDIVGVANRAIHGGEISSEDALRLVDAASNVLEELGHVAIEHALKSAKEEIVDQNIVNEYSKAEYTLTTLIPYVDKPEKRIYKLNKTELDAFLEGYNEHGEFIIELEKIDKDVKQN